jgi:formate hydrogenlyase subunit 3/multisubunit Na+/H+ antiporter MnhD subunit
LLWLVAFSNLALLAGDFILLMFAWGANLSLLYALLTLGSARTAKKALAIVGLADFSLMLGICLYVTATTNTLMPEGIKVVLDRPLLWASFIFMLVGALAKAGCAPFHSWIPEAAESAPIPVMAILPASLDKLLGIYLLARVCVDFFVMNNLVLGLLLILGSLTIIFAVMLALIQHDLRKLLSFHAISQVGYMVLGFGTGTVVGIAGGIFHMFNNAIYKTGLFFTGGAVGEQKKTFELDKLGGLIAYMPLTFLAGLVFALSISGIPLFNGFASKWLLYQGGIIGLFNTSSQGLRLIYIFALVAAMFGSALTLASFVKFIHAIFLGQDNSQDKTKAKEVSWKMKVPLFVLAGLCLLLGIFPNLFLKDFIEPWLPERIASIGNWDSQVAFLLLLSGLVLGLIFWNTNRSKKLRSDRFFSGGEDPSPMVGFPATGFYQTVQEIPAISNFYRLMRSEALDLYNILSGILNIISYLAFIFVDGLIYTLTNLTGYLVLGTSWLFRRAHTGRLDFYLTWSLTGWIIILFILMAK